MVFFSRGLGRGHAIPDIAIAEELIRQIPDLCLRFVSYSTGAQAFKAAGYDVIDIQLPDNPPPFELMTRQMRVIIDIRPRLVIAHEEFLVLPVAHTFDIPSILITDFFQDPTSLIMMAAAYASEVIFTGEAGVFMEPPQLSAKVRYVGPAVRRFGYSRADRIRARHELGLPPEAAVVLCQPGNWPESQVPISDLIWEAWGLFPVPSKYLIWLAWRDYDLIAARCQGRKDIAVFKEREDMGRLFAASDLVITKANRLTVFEAAALGLPSVSISGGVNWPDDVAIAHVQSNTALSCFGLDSARLADLFAERIGQRWQPEEATPNWDGIAGAAQRIVSRVEQTRSGGGECR